MENPNLNAIQNFDIPNPFKTKTIVDFQLCVGIEELKETLYEINKCGFVLI